MGSEADLCLRHVLFSVERTLNASLAPCLAESDRVPQEEAGSGFTREDRESLVARGRPLGMTRLEFVYGADHLLEPSVALGRVDVPCISTVLPVLPAFLLPQLLREDAVEHDRNLLIFSERGVVAGSREQLFV